MRSLVFKFVLLFLAQATVVAAGLQPARAGMCAAAVLKDSTYEGGRLVDRYSNAQVRERLKDLSFLKRVTRELDAQFLHESRALSRRMKSLPNEYDFIIVGAGGHGVQAAFTLAGKRILIVEGSNFVNNTFRRMGDAMILNSPELGAKGSTNPRYGGTFQVRDAMFEGYPLASQLRGVDVLRMKELKEGAKSANDQVDLLLGTHANELEPVVKDGRVVGVRMFLSNGAVCKATAVIHAGGLGRAKLPFKDQGTVQLVMKYLGISTIRTMPALMSYEGFMERVNAFFENGRDPREELIGKRVAIVGAGDGALVAIEALYGYAPQHIYSLPRRLAKMAVTWFGQKFSTPDKTVNDHPDRYLENQVKIFSKPDGHDKVIEPPHTVPHHLERIEEFSENGRVAFRLFPKDGGAPVTVDYVIIATGYEPVPIPIRGHTYSLGHNAVIIKDGIPVGQQVVTSSGIGLPVFIGGAQLGPKFATEKMVLASETENPVSFDVLISPTTKLAEHVREAAELVIRASAAGRRVK
ncbi:MAG TPA: hypothetical protein VFV50_09410 [Bdellovibrionales bacterium]|nr:hypothetical protein [Bdellovibrionales bacterium]